MKIIAVSRNDKHLAEIARLLRERSRTDHVDIIPGTLDRLPNAIALDLPDVMVLDQPSVQNGDFERIERLGAANPTMAFIVLSDDQSPAFLMEAMNAGVRQVLPCPVRADALYPSLARIDEKLQHHQQSNGKILAFVSCKGGSGATFLATNLGYALAELEGKRVALIDLNLQFGDASLFVSDHRPAATLADLALQIHRLDASLLASSMLAITPNYSLLAAPDEPVHANDIKPEHIDSLLRLARRHYDFVILDVGRSLDAISVRALDHADTVFPVLQTTLPYIRDGKRLLEVFRSLDYRANKIQLIVNRHQKDGDIKRRDLEGACGMPVFMSVPNHYEAAAASVNQGVPIIKLDKASPVSKALHQFARTLTGSSEASQGSWLGKLFTTRRTETRSEPQFEEKQAWMQKS